MDEKEKQTILQYNVEALKRNIATLEKDIVTWQSIIDKSEKVGHTLQVQVYTQSIIDAKKDIKYLKNCIKMIEEDKQLESC